MAKRLAVLGSTGSIGVNTLNVVRHLQGEFEVTALVARANIELLYEQICEFHPQVVVVANEEKAKLLRERLPNQPILSGMDGILQVVSEPSVDMVVAAMAGTAGILPIVRAIQAKKQIALANKEALVSAGALVMSLAKENGVKILPVDSEHNALFQCVDGERQAAIRRIMITSSGGPFRLFSDEQLHTATVQQALRHPNFVMGPKVSIDSSTLMNKGLEVLEAHWLFDVPLDRIEVVIQPQQIIHGMVEFVDGSMLAQLCEPDMLVPIQYALTYPSRRPGLLKPFDWTKHEKLEFLAPDTSRFRCLSLAYHAGRMGGTLPCYMNAANEVLVERFIKGQLSWKGISDKLEALMMRHDSCPANSVEDILAIDQMARQEATVA